MRLFKPYDDVMVEVPDQMVDYYIKRGYRPLCCEPVEEAPLPIEKQEVLPEMYADAYDEGTVKLEEPVFVPESFIVPKAPIVRKKNKKKE